MAFIAHFTIADATSRSARSWGEMNFISAKGNCLRLFNTASTKVRSVQSLGDARSKVPSKSEASRMTARLSRSSEDTKRMARTLLRIAVIAMVGFALSAGKEMAKCLNRSWCVESSCKASVARPFDEFVAEERFVGLPAISVIVSPPMVIRHWIGAILLAMSAYAFDGVGCILAQEP